MHYQKFYLVFLRFLSWWIRLYRYFYHYFTPTRSAAIKRDRTWYEVPYSLGVRNYRYLLRRRLGPTRVTTIQDETGVIRSDLLEFLGPNEDWHGAHLTPRMLGCQQLTIHYRDEEPKVWAADRLLFPKEAPRPTVGQ